MREVNFKPMIYRFGNYNIFSRRVSCVDNQTAFTQFWTDRVTHELSFSTSSCFQVTLVVLRQQNPCLKIKLGWDGRSVKKVLTL